MNDKDEFEIEKSEDGYRVKTGPLTWTEAHVQRDRIMRAKKLEEQNKELWNGIVWAAAIVFIACLIAGYVVAVYVL